MKLKKESEEKAGLKLNSPQTNIIAPGPITSWQIDGEKVDSVRDVCSLEGKLWQTYRVY